MPFDFSEFLKQAAMEAGEEVKQENVAKDIQTLLSQADAIIEQISQDGTVTLSKDPVEQQDKENAQANAEQQMEASTPPTDPAPGNDPVQQTNEEIKEQNAETVAEAMTGMPSPSEINQVADEIMETLTNPEKGAALFDWAMSHVYDLIEDYHKVAYIIDKAPEDYREPLEKQAMVDVILLGYATMNAALRNLAANEKSAALIEQHMPYTFKFLEGDDE